MPLSGANRTNFLSRLDTAFAALEAGNDAIPDQTFEFTLNSVRYIASFSGVKKADNYIVLNAMIKRVA